MLDNPVHEGFLFVHCVEDMGKEPLWLVLISHCTWKIKAMTYFVNSISRACHIEMEPKALRDRHYECLQWIQGWLTLFRKSGVDCFPPF